MEKQTFIAHSEALATAVVGAFVGGATTLVGQGVPDLHTQGFVAFAFGAFSWLVAIVHRWKTSPADVERDVVDAGPTLLRELAPVLGVFLQRLASPCPDCAQRASSSSASNPPAGKS